MDEAIKEHVEIFGVRPVITGINYHDQDSIIDGIEEAIEKGIPYVELDVEKGVIV